MTATLSRANELRNDIENMQFNVKYYIGVLAELEQLGRTNTEEYKRIKYNLGVIKGNIKRIEAEIDKIESEWIDEELLTIDAEELLQLW